MKSNIASVLSLDFFRSWAKALRRDPVMMFKLSVLAILAVLGLAILRAVQTVDRAIQREPRDGLSKPPGSEGR